MNDKKIKKKCEYCGKIFTPEGNHPNLQKYCSMICKNNKNKKTLRHCYICANCGKEIWRSTKAKGKLQFCNNTCQKKHLHNLTYEDRKCEICKKLFHCAKRSKQRFCGDNCQIKWQTTLKREQTGYYNTTITEEDRSLICQECGKNFRVNKPYKIKTQKYCSIQCKRIGVIKERVNNTTWLERTRSQPQIITDNILNELNINFINEYPCGYFSIDNYLNDLNLGIEVMGQYWHTDPRKYENYINEMQRKGIITDKRKRTFIFNKKGFYCLYLWESDLIENKEFCKNLITYYIKNNGIIPNYHSFNYHLEENNIMINPVLFISFMDKKI